MKIGCLKNSDYYIPYDNIFISKGDHKSSFQFFESNFNLKHVSSYFAEQNQMLKYIYVHYLINAISYKQKLPLATTNLYLNPLLNKNLLCKYVFSAE